MARLKWNNKDVQKLAPTLQLAIARSLLDTSVTARWLHGGIVVSKRPDMSRVVRSEKATAAGQVFGEAVAFARAVVRDPVRKASYEQQLGSGRLFQKIVAQRWGRSGAAKRCADDAHACNAHAVANRKVMCMLRSFVKIIRTVTDTVRTKSC